MSTPVSRYLLRTDGDLTPRYVTMEQAIAEIQEREPEKKDVDLLRKWLRLPVSIGTRTWSPLAAPVERWVVFNPNSSNAYVYKSLVEAEEHLVDHDYDNGLTISPVYA